MTAPSRSITRSAALLAVLVAAIAGLGACTSAGGGGASSNAHGGVAADAPAPGAVSRAAGSSAGGKVSTGTGGAYSVAGTTVDLGSAKIRTADMTVAVLHGRSVAAKADQAETIALGAGGEVDGDDRTSGRSPTATLLLRVPPEQLAAVLDQLSRLGTERSRHLSTQDVTSAVADVTSRVASARREITRLRVLYTHAVKISDIIRIESELSGRESDLESLQARQRALTTQTATAAITLTLVTRPATPPPAPAKEHHRSGFLGGLQSGWNAFARGAAVLATAVGAVLPFALLLAVLLIAARLLWPRLRPSRPVAPTPEA